MHEFALKVEDFNFAVLKKIDTSIAKAIALQGCPFCQGKLHYANYQRKPRGGRLIATNEEYSLRYSLCCSREGCRKRVLPASLIFLGRRVYLEAVVIMSCYKTSATPWLRTLRAAAKLYGICAREHDHKN